MNSVGTIGKYGPAFKRRNHHVSDHHPVSADVSTHLPHRVMETEVRTALFWSEALRGDESKKKAFLLCLLHSARNGDSAVSLFPVSYLYKTAHHVTNTYTQYVCIYTLAPMYLLT